MATTISRSLLVFVLCAAATIIVQTPFAVSAENGGEEAPKTPPTTPKPPTTAKPPAPPAKDDAKKCQVSSFKTQEDFDSDEYGGAWYVISDMGIFSYQHTFDLIFYLAQDVKSFFIPQEDGSYTVISAGRNFGFCRIGEGVATEDDEAEDPAKLMVSYPDTWFPLPKAPTPYWVIATDYEFAVVYSCRNVLEDGTCDPKQTFAWTLNRELSGHDDAQQAAIDKKLEGLCLDPKKFITMPRTRPCPEIEVKEDDDDEDDSKAEL